jgi:hypothetical protein
MDDRTRGLSLEWETELDRLDVEVLWAERLLSASRPLDRTGWTPPTPSGPLPVHLLPRAVEIHKRQGVVLDKLLRSMRMTAQHRVYVEHMTDQAESLPRYVDVEG